MSVLAKLNSDARSVSSSSPSSSSSSCGIIGGISDGFSGSKKPGGLSSEATSSRFINASPASLKPAASPARGSDDRLTSNAFMRSISVAWSLVMSVVNSNSTGSYADPGCFKSSSTIVTAPSWCVIINVRNSWSKAVPFNSASSAICSGEAMPAILWVVCIASCAVGSGMRSPRSRNHCCMNSISSSCEASMRPDTSTSSGRFVRSATSSDICTAWLWCGIMSCMNSTSSGEWLVTAISIASSAVSTRAASPGAPG